MNEQERLLKLIAENNMSAKQFAAEVGIQAGTISNIVNGRNNPSLDVMQRVLNRFRTLNSDWLILGVGNMYRSEGGSMENRENTQNTLNNVQNTQSSQNTDKQHEIPGLYDAVAEQQTKEQPLHLSRPNSTTPISILSREMPPMASIKKQQATPKEQLAAKQIERIIVFYSDGTFEEITAK